MNDINQIIGKNIRILRKQRGQTLQSLSKEVGVSHQQLSRIENGCGTSNLTLERIAAILNVDMKYLIDEPEATLQRSISKTKNYIPEQSCQQMYAKMFDDVIKCSNDIAIDKFMEEVVEKLVKDQGQIRNLMCTHAGTKEIYEFTPSDLQAFCQQILVDFVAKEMELSKVQTEDLE